MFSRIYVEITNKCNRACSFCPGVKRSPSEMSERDFLHILSELTGVTEYVYYHVMGEPLTHPLLPRFISLARENGFRSVVTTNGTLLRERGDELIVSGIYKINISLHSFENLSYREYLEYMSDCLDFADKASSRGILVILRLWNRGFDEGRNIDTLELIKSRFGTDSWTDDSRGARVRHKLHLEYGERFNWPSTDAEDMGDDLFCYALRDHAAILCDGTVIPCCLDSEGNIALGNVFSSSLKEILSSDRARALVNGFNNKKATEELCRRCGYARRFSK